MKITFVGVEMKHRELLVKQYNLKDDATMDDCMVAFADAFNNKLIRANKSLHTVEFIRIYKDTNDYEDAIRRDGRSGYCPAELFMGAEFEVSDNIDVIDQMSLVNALNSEYSSRIK